LKFLQSIAQGKKMNINQRMQKSCTDAPDDPAQESRTDIEGGKYTIVHTNGVGLHILRHGEDWLQEHEVHGGKMFIAIASELDALRAIPAQLVEASMPVKQEPFALKFPQALRKMWSGGEVQNWLNQLPPLYEKVTP
jgi:hypothetical protein